MDARYMSRTLVALSVAAALTAEVAPAQERAISLRFDAGVATPMGTLDDFYDPGPSFGAMVVYPFRDQLSLVLKTDVDLLNNHDFWPVPDTRFWRYELGVEADVLGLLGSAMDNYGVRLYGGLGGATMESDQFLTEFVEPVFPYAWEELSNTYLSGTAALSVGFGLTEVVSGWLTGQINWSPVDEADMAILGEASSFTLEPFGSAMVGSLRLGFSYRLGD